MEGILDVRSLLARRGTLHMENMMAVNRYHTASWDWRRLRLSVRVQDMISSVMGNEIRIHSGLFCFCAMSERFKIFKMCPAFVGMTAGHRRARMWLYFWTTNPHSLPKWLILGVFFWSATPMVKVWLRLGNQIYLVHFRKKITVMVKRNQRWAFVETVSNVVVTLCTPNHPAQPRLLGLHAAV